jgi:hypothetical protein
MGHAKASESAISLNRRLNIYGLRCRSARASISAYTTIRRDLQETEHVPAKHRRMPMRRDPLRNRRRPRLHPALPLLRLPAAKRRGARPRRPHAQRRVPHPPGHAAAIRHVARQRQRDRPRLLRRLRHAALCAGCDPPGSGWSSSLHPGRSELVPPSGRHLYAQRAAQGSRRNRCAEI